MNNYSSADDGKTASIISYFFILGWLIAYFGIYVNNKTALASYQLRQTLLFHLVAMVIYYAIGALAGAIFFTSGIFIGVALIWIVRTALIILWIIGFIGAVNGERKPIPFIGERAQSIFSGI
jgi:uncharacterized membrane protein